MTEKKLSREEIARREIGSTSISRGVSLFLSFCFLFTIFAVPVSQSVIDGEDSTRVSFVSVSAGEEVSWLSRATRVNKEILRSIDLLESEIEEKSFLRALFLPPFQYVFTKYLGQGNEKVISGSNNQLFYRPAVDYLIGPPFLDKDQQNKRSEGHEVWEEPVQPDPVKTIVSFSNQLASRNIELVLLPVPVKASIRASSLALKNVDGPLTSRSWNSFIKLLEEAGITVFDIRNHLYDFEKNYGNAYLETDTHWSPAAMKMVAGRLAEFLTERHPGLYGDIAYRFHLIRQNGVGDLRRMLTLPESSALFSDAELEIEQVLTMAGALWQPDRESQVLLLGDSFTNIYSSSGLGMGDSAGFAEHLSYRLRQPVDLLARNDDGAYITREMLATELLRGRDRLADKRLVVWQFAERELAFGDWKEIGLTLGSSKPSDFFTIDFGAKANVEATIADVSRSPRPGTVPYRDNIVTIHLVDLQSDKVPGDDHQALVYGFGMRDNKMTALAMLRPGDRVSLTLSSWEEREPEYGSYRRTSLDDEMIELELPNWGVIHDNKTD